MPIKAAPQCRLRHEKFQAHWTPEQFNEEFDKIELEYVYDQKWWDRHNTFWPPKMLVGLKAKAVAPNGDRFIFFGRSKSLTQFVIDQAQ